MFELTTQLLIFANILWLPLCRINKFGLNTLPSKTVAIPYTCGLSHPKYVDFNSYEDDLLGDDDLLVDNTSDESNSNGKVNKRRTIYGKLVGNGSVMENYARCGSSCNSHNLG